MIKSVDDLNIVQLSLIYLYLQGYTKFSFNQATSCWILSKAPSPGSHISACDTVHFRSGHFMAENHALAIMQEENISLKWDKESKNPCLTLEAFPEISVCDKEITKALKKVIILKELFISQNTLDSVMEDITNSAGKCTTFKVFEPLSA